MESETRFGGSDDARAHLAAADLARGRLTTGLKLPRGLHPALAGAVAVQISTAAVGIAEQTALGLGLLLAGLGVFLAVATWLLHRFRRINGVRVDGLTGRVVLGSGTTSSVAYVWGLGGATWAAFESQWWLVGLAAVIGGVGYALGARQWWDAYRADPSTHARGASPQVLAVLALVAALGFVVLMVVG